VHDSVQQPAENDITPWFTAAVPPSTLVEVPRMLKVLTNRAFWRPTFAYWLPRMVADEHWICAAVIVTAPPTIAGREKSGAPGAGATSARKPGAKRPLLTFRTLPMAS
jgi:hypothetical protein